jgi:hypothetical protein
MANLLTLTLNRVNIIDAVKADTFITGQIDKSADAVKNAALAFHESAGDDNYHEVKLLRTLRGAIAKFEANMVEFVDTSDANAAITNTLNPNNDTFAITLNVASRFNRAFAGTLASLAETFLINMMLYDWWQSAKPSLAKDYYAAAQDSLVYVRQCLAKSAPAVSQQSYAGPTGEVVEPQAPAGSGTTTETTETTETTNP